MKPLNCLPYLATLFFIPISLSCSSDDNEKSPEEQLPPITQTGENTFGCLIDGELFVPRDGTGTFAGPDRGLRLIGYENDLDIDARSYGDELFQVVLHLENALLRLESNYELSDSNGQSSIDGPDHDYAHCKIWNKSLERYDLYVSFPGSGSVHLTFHDHNPGSYRIFSGTFQSLLVNARNRNDTIFISSGRYDIETIKLMN